MPEKKPRKRATATVKPMAGAKPRPDVPMPPSKPVRMRSAAARPGAPPPEPAHIIVRCIKPVQKLVIEVDGVYDDAMKEKVKAFGPGHYHVELRRPTGTETAMQIVS